MSRTAVLTMSAHTPHNEDIAEMRLLIVRLREVLSSANALASKPSFFGGSIKLRRKIGAVSTHTLRTMMMLEDTIAQYRLEGR